MPAFKRFGPGDQLDNVLVLEPAYNLASGNLGWRGSPEGSASLSLYGGPRRSPAFVVQYADYQSIFPGASALPRPRVNLPATASINLVWMTDEVLTLTQRYSTRWGNEHWGTVQRLYQDYAYRDPDFVTGTYDYYSLYFQKDSGNAAMFAPPNSQGLFMTSSFTVESWVKPFITASSNQDFTIASTQGVFWFGITGSTGQLVLSSSQNPSSYTASIGPTVNRWSHVAVVWDAVSLTGTFYVNLSSAGTFIMPTALPAPSASFFPVNPAFVVGQQVTGSWVNTLNGHLTQYAPTVVLQAGNPYTQFAGQPLRSFHGFVAETRLWFLSRTWAQLSASAYVTLTGSAVRVTGSIVSARFNEGPLGMFPTDVAFSAPSRMGSGTVDIASLEQIRATTGVTSRYPWGWLIHFDDRVGPVWHPNDNLAFVPPKVLATVPQTDPYLITAFAASSLTGSSIAQAHRMLVIDVPQAFYGRQIVPGTVVITDRTYSSGSYGLVRVLNDDGRGNLYLSGSVSSSSLAGREDYNGVTWNKVGNVFYGEGLIVIKEQSLLDMWRPDGFTSHPNDLLQLSFRGQSRVPVKTLMCRVDRGDVNASANPTFWSTDADGNRIRRHPSGSIYATTVGIYNSQRELVGVARFAEPIRIRGRDRFNLKLRMDF